MQAKAREPRTARPPRSNACKFYTALILGALKGWSKEDLLSPDFYQGSLVPEIAEIAVGSYRRKNPLQIVGTGSVVKSLEPALWSFYRSSTFERGARCSLLTWATMPTPPPPCLAN